MTEGLLLASTHISTFDHQALLTKATGFFFERDGRLFLVTSRHVVLDVASKHHPDRIEIELHSDAANLAASTAFSIPLYRRRKSAWRQGVDAGGEIDVAAIELERDKLPVGMAYQAFTPDHLYTAHADGIGVGTSLLIVGFPLGFHDTLHHLPVVRQSVVASSFGMRFQGQGFFLTDARTHRGISGAAVVARKPDAAADDPLPWLLLGVHSSRFDVGSRDLKLDEALGLNCAWYADILLTLTQ